RRLGLGVGDVCAPLEDAVTDPATVEMLVAVEPPDPPVAPRPAAVAVERGSCVPVAARATALTHPLLVLRREPPVRRVRLRLGHPLRVEPLAWRQLGRRVRSHRHPVLHGSRASRISHRWKTWSCAGRFTYCSGGGSRIANVRSCGSIT